MSIRFITTTISLALALSGCGAWQAVSDSTASAYHAVFFKQIKTLNVDLSARDGLNADEAGRPTSVAVRVYQLNDRKLFDAASYDDLLKNDRTVLAQDLQASMASVLNPGASVSLSQPMEPGTRYVAIVALYREPGKDGAWKRVIEKKKLDADKPLRLTLVDRQIEAPDDAAQKQSTR